MLLALCVLTLAYFSDRIWPASDLEASQEQVSAAATAGPSAQAAPPQRDVPAITAAGVSVTLAPKQAERAADIDLPRTGGGVFAEQSWPGAQTAQMVAYDQPGGPVQDDPLAERSLPIPPKPTLAPPRPVLPEHVEEVPLGDPRLADQVQVSMHNDLLTLTARDAPLASVLSLIAKQHGLNIISGSQISQRVSVSLTDVRLEDALDTLLAVNGYTWSTQRNILIVSPLDGEQKSGPMVQGRILRVYPLNYVAASDVDRVVKGLLSPVGQSFIVEVTPTDQRRTQEQIVVEDLPYYVARIEEYVHSIDYQPRQVVVEAHVLQVQLKDDLKHGVNFEEILRIANTDVTFQAAGFANPAAPQAGFLKVNGTDLTAVIEALKTTTDAKTLASPQVAVLNGQEARFQVGGQIGYLTTTTTETAAVQTVNFLETGVILHVTPIITVDRQVLMNVRPEVSTGRINPTTDLPESETTRVETRVMLADGEAVVIGGLIKEIDNEVQNKIPWLGDVKYVGRLFQRRTINRERSEVIIALRPRIMEETPGLRQADPCKIQQATTPLFVGPLDRVDRAPWEAQFPDATCNPPRYPAPPAIQYGPSEMEALPVGSPTPAVIPQGHGAPPYEPLPPPLSRQPPAATGVQPASHIVRESPNAPLVRLPAVETPQP